jgi:glyoxylase-like metal-dependent hydrolase (beta-lactamase superfamily II)
MLPKLIEYPQGITCTSLSTPGILKVLASKGIAADQVVYIMPTHVHMDHASGTGSLVEALPRARVVAHPLAAQHLIDPSKLIAGAMAVYGAEHLAATYGVMKPVPADRIITAADGLQLSLETKTGGKGSTRKLQFLDSPGHARHHYVIWDELSRGFFTGDTFGLSYREFDGPAGNFLLPTTTPVQFDPHAWFATLDRMMTYKPQYMYLTHYGRVTDVPRLTTILRRGIDTYIRIAGELNDVPDRHRQLKRALFAQALEELALIDCPLSEAQARALLEPDIELNAQGLAIWLNRQRAAAAA